MVDDLNWESELDFARLEKACRMLSTNPEYAITEFKALADMGSLNAMFYLGMPQNMEEE